MNLSDLLKHEMYLEDILDFFSATVNDKRLANPTKSSSQGAVGTRTYAAL